MPSVQKPAAADLFDLAVGRRKGMDASGGVGREAGGRGVTGERRCPIRPSGNPTGFIETMLAS